MCKFQLMLFVCDIFGLIRLIYTSFNLRYGYFLFDFFLRLVKSYGWIFFNFWMTRPWDQ